MKELEAKMFYQTNHTHIAERPKNAAFLSLVTLTFKLVRARDQTRLPCEFGANRFSGSEVFHTQTKNHRLMAPKTEPWRVVKMACTLYVLYTILTSACGTLTTNQQWHEILTFLSFSQI